MKLFFSGERHNAAHPHQLPQPSISIQLDPLITQESTENGDSCLVEDVSGVAAQGVEPMEGDSLRTKFFCLGFATLFFLLKSMFYCP